MDAPAGGASGGLYAAQQKVYPREVRGRFRTLRTTAVFVLLGLFYIVPWLQWSGRQAVLFDLPARRFYIFGLTFFPQDFFFLTWLLIIAALSLFFFTAVAGRLWCGFACPQTVWTEVFVWLEQLTEGNRSQRMKLDKGPWTAVKLVRKSAKQVLWITFAAFTGITFVGFFSPVRGLVSSVAGMTLGSWEAFWIVFYGFATYGNAGYLREQVCKYMCPYARFQSAMFDRQTLIISYDTARGEPRGARGRDSDYKAKGLGDCVDCTLCVQVCPTGIDIRKGLQYECIACAACIDACDDVMAKVGYPGGLIRYSTQAALEGKPSRILRPRSIVYATLLLALVAGFVVAVAMRSPIGMEVLRDRNALYRETDGLIENVYTVRIVNKAAGPQQLTLRLEGPEALSLEAETAELDLGPGEVRGFPVRVRMRAGALSGGRKIELEAIDSTGEEIASGESRFIAP
jgi:cytochrome c oxidase accessory protein FixG